MEYDVYKCKNKQCSYYLQELKQLTEEEQVLYQTAPYHLKLHYIYRQFQLKLEDIQSYGLIHSPVDLSRIHSSPRLLGEILTYHVNYGLSAPKVAALLYDLHGIKIGRQTILNYAAAAGAQLHTLTQHYPYELSDKICGDETYIRVGSKWHYICYFFDAEKKIILSQRMSDKRDTTLAIKAIHDVLSHYTLEGIPEDLNLIVDGNPIYKLAQHFLAQHGFHFEITQVIGLTNQDEVSKQYRPLKQIIERLNRTYKGNYRGTYGFHSENGARAHVACFSACFNFLRPHQSLGGEVPVKLAYVHDGVTTMPDKWIRLLSLGNAVLSQEQ